MKNIYKFKKAFIFLSLTLAGYTVSGQAVTTDNINTITSSTAYVAATVTDTGTNGLTQRGVCYGLLTNPTIADSIRIATGTGLGFYEVQLTNLTNPTTYHVRAYIISAVTGTVYYGADKKFTTFPPGSFAYSCKAQNDFLVDATTYQFDVYIYSNTNPSDLWLNNYQLAFEVWNVGSTSGTLTGSFISGTSDLPAAFQPSSSPIVFRADASGGSHFDMVIAGPPASSNGTQIPYSASGPGTRIGSFKMVYNSGGVPSAFPNVQLNMVWDNDVLGKTIVYAISPPGPSGTVVNNTNFDAHLPVVAGPPLNNPIFNTAQWTGATSTDWNTTTNWKANPTSLVPTAATEVLIPGGLTQYPLLNSLDACNTALIQNGGKITIANNGSLTINSNLTMGTNSTNPNPMIILSDATGTGSLITKGTISGTGAGNAIAQRYVTGNWTGGNPTPSTLWHYVSSPISSATINVFLNCLMNSWNETTRNWDPLTLPTTLPMVKGQGYSVAAFPAYGTAIFTGTLNTGNQTVSLTNGGGGGTTYSGWNLVGNPFPCSLDWTLVTPPTGMDAAAYVWDQSYGNYRTTITQSPYGTFDGKIPSEQGFFVHVTTNLSFTVPASARVHGTGYYKKTTLMTDYIDLKVDGNGYSDEIMIHFDPDATEGFDEAYDAYKMGGLEAAPQLYSILPEENLTVNTLPDISVHPVIRLGFTAGANAEYKITTTGLESFAESADLYIEDLLTQNVQDLNANPIYTFNAEPGQPEHRFNLHFAPVGISEKDAGNIKIYSDEKDIYVNIPGSIQGEIVIYNLLGMELLRKPAIGNSLNKITINGNSGYYLVKVSGDKMISTGKVYIR